MRRLLICFVMFGFVIGSSFSAWAVSVGEPAPDFQSKTLEGKDFRLSDYKGEPIVLKVGTTWCPTCRAQTVALDSLHQYMASEGVRFVDVFIDESDVSVRKYFNKGGYHRPSAIILDEGSAYKAYNIYVIPRLVLIDKEFKVVRDGDAVPAPRLKKMLTKMLGE